MNSQHLSHPKYRADIDGLRAFAVLSVVAFHAFPNWLTGGFVGVDVFFVISGFLISTIIFENLSRETFSFTEFYVRRVKRIFPALLLVLLFTYAFGWFALLASEYQQLGKHLFAGAAFASNLALQREAGYFDNSAETKPLLHLWSLGIEEQFYIVWPLLLWLGWRWKFNLGTTTILVAIASFILNIREVETDTVAAFYSPQTRFWELLGGSLLAWLSLYRKDAYTRVNSKLAEWFSAAGYKGVPDADGAAHNVLSFAGLFLLGYGFVRLDKGFSFPGKWALIPVVGSVLLISAGPKTWINRNILSSRVAVWFGLISFPLYLWHWPLLSFAQIIEGETPSRVIRITAVVLSVVLAWFTYLIVEKPMRFGGHSRVKVVALVILMSIAGCVGYITYTGEGLVFRHNATLSDYSGDIGHLEYHKYIAQHYYVCTPGVIAKEALRWAGFVRCDQSQSTPDVDIVLLGDSHAEHLFLGMADALPTKNIAFYIKAGAPFIGNVEFKNSFDTILASKTIQTVVIAMTRGGKYYPLPSGSTLDTELIKVVDALNKAGKKVYLTDDIPIFPFGPERCQGKRWLTTKDPICEIGVDDVKSQSEIYIGALNNVVQRRPDVKILKIGKYLCDSTTCSMTRGTKILYRDNNHLNVNGSLYVGRRLVEDNAEVFR